MNLNVGLPITPEDWEKTPPSVLALVITFWEETQILKTQAARPQSQVETLQGDEKRLNERLDKNSQNSSKPPSSDPPQTKKVPQVELSGEKNGGRNGHPGHGRKLKPADQISRIVKCVPSISKDCGATLKGVDARPERHQVSELPKIIPEFVEYRRNTLNCDMCGAIKSCNKIPVHSVKISPTEDILQISKKLS